jgi:hypothetical protein
MCYSKRQQRQLFQREISQQQLALQPRQRGCYGSRRAQRQALQLQAPEVSVQQQGFYQPTYLRPPQSMAGILAVGIGIGCEKLGRKISEKRSERKEKKAIEVCSTSKRLMIALIPQQREANYGHAESSTASAANTKISQRPREQERKSDEVRREREGVYERRRSVSSERTLLPEDAPPQYEEAVRQGVRRA